MTTATVISFAVARSARANSARPNPSVERFKAFVDAVRQSHPQQLHERDDRYAAMNALPFVTFDPGDDNPCRMPEHYWSVTTTGGQNNRNMGRQYARLAVKAMRLDGCSWLLRHIVDDMIRAEKAAPDKTTRTRLEKMRRYFFQDLGKLIIERSNSPAV